jgi:EAL domain-containing protein (putative c-di-GMP-specific phosphodiesterase class I)
VAQLASSLGMETTAEGIETQEELEYLRRVGCTEGQGYFFGKAQPAKDICSMLPVGGKPSKAVA